jgi:hypothetical protein
LFQFNIVKIAKFAHNRRSTFYIYIDKQCAKFGIRDYTKYAPMIVMDGISNGLKGMRSGGVNIPALSKQVLIMQVKIFAQKISTKCAHPL